MILSHHSIYHQWRNNDSPFIVIHCYFYSISNSSFPTEILLSKVVSYGVSSVTLATESVRELKFSFDQCNFLSFLRAALFCTLPGSARMLVIIVFIIDYIFHFYLYSSTSPQRVNCRVLIFIFIFVQAPPFVMSHYSLFVLLEAPPVEMLHSFRSHRSTSSWDVELFISLPSKHLHLRCRITHFVIIEAPLLEMSNYSFRYHRSTST